MLDVDVGMWVELSPRHRVVCQQLRQLRVPSSGREWTDGELPRRCFLREREITIVIRRLENHGSPEYLAWLGAQYALFIMIGLVDELVFIRPHIAMRDEAV